MAKCEIIEPLSVQNAYQEVNNNSGGSKRRVKKDEGSRNKDRSRRRKRIENKVRLP